MKLRAAVALQAVETEPRIRHQGMTVRVENPRGSVRQGVNRETGKPWRTEMKYPYGEIENSMGLDGDPVDVYVGPDPGAQFVYVVHQLNPQTGEWDEDKCMLGFPDAMAAKEAYEIHYDEPEKFYGSMSTIAVDRFKEIVFRKEISKLAGAGTSAAGGWHGVDLDGTLAVYTGWKGATHIGAPIQPMVQRVKKWLANGEDVRIFTARINKGGPEIKKAIEDWCEKYIGQKLPVTNIKDNRMVDLWDDRAKRVEKNTGQVLAQKLSDFYKGQPVSVDGFQSRAVVRELLPGDRVRVRFWNTLQVTRHIRFVHPLSENSVNKMWKGDDDQHTIGKGPGAVNAGGQGSGCHGSNCGRPSGKGSLPEGSAGYSWKEAVVKAAKRYPESIMRGLKVDWTDMPLHGGFAYMSPTRLLIGMSEAIPKYAIQHELGHRAYDLLSKDSRDVAERLFGKSWIISSHITAPYKRAESAGTWTREDKRYEAMLIARKRVHEQAAEALRMYVMKEPLPSRVKNWAADAIKSLKTLHAAEEWSELREGRPVDRGSVQNARIEKQGTQFCVKTATKDENWGCFPSREQAEARMAGRPGFGPDVEETQGGGEGSGCKGPNCGRPAHEQILDHMKSKASDREFTTRELLKKFAHIPEQQVHEALAHLIADGKLAALSSGPRSGHNVRTTVRYMVRAAGTPEGARKGWDTRGRSKRTEARVDPRQASLYGPQHHKELSEWYSMRKGQVDSMQQSLERAAQAFTGQPRGQNDRAIYRDHEAVATRFHDAARKLLRAPEAQDHLDRARDHLEMARNNSGRNVPIALGNLGSAYHYLRQAAGVRPASEPESVMKQTKDPRQGELFARGGGHGGGGPAGGGSSGGSSGGGKGPGLAEIGIKTPKAETGNIAHYKEAMTTRPHTPAAKEATSKKHYRISKKKLTQTKYERRRRAMRADVGGEPTAGAYSTGTIDPVVWFHPPSLTKRLPNEETRVPSDDPREKNDKYLDVSKRKAPETQTERMKLTKKQQVPGGMTEVPARTTLVVPHTATYLPGSLNAAARGRRRRAAGGGIFVSYNRQGCV